MLNNEATRALNQHTVATGGLEPPKRDPHLIYSQTPLPLGTNRHKDDYRAYPCHFNGSNFDHQRQDSNVLL